MPFVHEYSLDSGDEEKRHEVGFFATRREE